MDAATIGAVFTGCAGIIAAITALVRVITTRPRLPVAEELLEQIDELRADVLALARWAHNARALAAAEGVELPDPPEILRSSGEREGERQHDPDDTGWRSSVRAQTGPQRRVEPHEVRGPRTQPDRRRRPTPPTREADPA